MALTYQEATYLSREAVTALNRAQDALDRSVGLPDEEFFGLSDEIGNLTQLLWEICATPVARCTEDGVLLFDVHASAPPTLPLDLEAAVRQLYGRALALCAQVVGGPCNQPGGATVSALAPVLVGAAAVGSALFLWRLV